MLVDTQVIANGPVRAFVAGMGDALSTWIEADAAFKSRAQNIAGGHPTMAAMAIARLCFETLLEHGLDAKRDVEHHVVTPAVEKVVEANVLLSGLGFESGGLATAHMIGNLLSNVPECKQKGLMHGEKVAFGIITQLCLDDDCDVDDKIRDRRLRDPGRTARDVCRTEPGRRDARQIAGDRRAMRRRGLALPQPSV